MTSLRRSAWEAIKGLEVKEFFKNELVCFCHCFREKPIENNQSLLNFGVVRRLLYR